jgi:hypothetical protein
VTARHAPAGWRWLVGAAASLAAWSAATVPVAAHLAIRLDIQAPEPDQHVDPDTEVVIFAQPTLAGVDHAAFTASLDGRPVDPVSGRPTPQPVSTEIRVSASTRIPLHGLSSGNHRFTISYRPDTDEPIKQSTVDFVVRKRRVSRLPWVGLGAAALAVGAALTVNRRRRRS